MKRTRWRKDMIFMFDWQERDHKIHMFEPTCNVLFVLDILMTAFFEDFPKIPYHFPAHTVGHKILF